VDSSLLFFFYFVFVKFGFRFGFLHNFFRKPQRETEKKPYIYCTALVRKSMKKYPLKMHNILIIRVIFSNIIIFFLVHEEGIQTSLTTRQTAITRQYNCYFIIRTQNTQQLATCLEKKSQLLRDFLIFFFHWEIKDFLFV